MMDLTSAPKCVKLDGNRGGGGSDRLSNIPNEVLHHILSLLPFEDVVRMSVLSKKWKNQWAFTPTFQFDEYDFLRRNEISEGRSLFMSFVDRAFALRGKSSLKALTLSCDIREDASHIKDWISAAIRSNVQDLLLSFNWSEDSFEYPEDIFTKETLVKELYLLPKSFFRSETLVKLGLYMRSPYYILRLPSSIGFSRLKVLNLSCIVFLDDDATRELFACPLLETVSVSVCSSKNLKVFRVDAPKLKVFSIRDSFIHQEVRIHGACLETFYYASELGNRCFISSSSINLVEAEIDVPHHYESWFKRDSVATNGCELLSNLSRVKKLALFENFIKYLQQKEDLPEALPIFSHLTKLVLWGVDARLDCKALLTILRRCPRLGTLKFCGGLNEFRHGDWEELLEPLPSCFQTHLKKIVIKFFGCTSDEVFILLVLLRAAVVLEEVVIYYTFSSWDEEIQELMDLRKKLHVGSNFRINFYPENE